MCREDFELKFDEPAIITKLIFADLTHLLTGTSFPDRLQL